MLPRANRLTKKKDFESVFKTGKIFRDGVLLFKTTENNLKESRFGFVVSKKISNKANIRNKVKRRLRQAVLANMGEMKKSLDVIVVALSGIQNKEFIEIQNIVAKFIKNINFKV